MEDYAGNSHKNKPKDQPQTEKEEAKEPKQLTQVVKAELVVPKKTVGQKIKGLILAADMASVGRYMIWDIMLPAFKSMVVETGSRGIERLFYGENSQRRGHYTPGGARYTYYNAPSSPSHNRGYVPDPRQRHAPPVEVGPRRSPTSNGPAIDFVIPTRGEAELILEQMVTVLEKYECVTVGDLHELVGYEHSTYIDQNWGWYSLQGANLRPIPQGIMLEFPPPVSLDR